MRRLLCVVLGVTLVACRSGDGEEAASSDERAARIYSAVIEDIAATGPERSGDPLPLFVEGVGGYEFPLEVQVQVVHNLKKVGRVRFIDQRAEAVQLAVAKEPVRNGGLLILLNPVVGVGGEGERVEVVADRYVRLDDVVRSRYTVEEAGGEWKTVGDPVTTPTTLAPARRRDGS